LRAIKSYPVVQTIHDYTVICPTGLNLHKNNEVCETGIRPQCFWQHQTKHHPLIYLAMSISFYLLRKRLKKTVNAFLVPSPLLTDYLQKNKFNHAEYIPPFKTENVSHATSRIKPHHFLFAGHLGFHKGVHLLLEEFALACIINPQLRLTIAGTGPEEKRMRSHARALNIESQVNFVSWQKNLDTFYDEHVAILFPSIGLEAFGLVMIEAMNRSRPIIGINRGTSAWMIDDNETGLLFDPHIKGDLAKKILRLANDINLSNTLGAQGQKKLKRFIDNDAALKQITMIYQQLNERRA
jgi:glycosyltransferase involved in cell wall biosynthesis